jgi:DNA-binding response OmpR family regulator
VTHPRRPAHVLVVDGEQAVLDLVRVLLEEEGYHVTTRDFVDTDLEAIAALTPDLVVLDLACGRPAGWELLEALAGHVSTRGIPVLVMSTNRELLAMAAADPARFGTHPDLVKPFAIEVLLAAVQDLAGAAEDRSARAG